MKSRVRRPLTAALVALMLAAACTSKNEDKIHGANESLDAPAQTSTPETAAASDEPGVPSDLDALADPTAGVSDDTIRIGVHLPETLSGIPIGEILGIGKLSDAFWSYTNANGGINGRTVEAILVDDGYNVNTAVESCRELVDSDVLFISGTSGADQIVTCGQLALDRGIPYMSLGVSEAGLVDQPGYRALTLTYDQQAPVAADYIVDALGGDTQPVAMVRFNSPNADGAHQAFVEAMRDRGVSLAVDDAVDKDGNPNELTAECLKLAQEDVGIVFTIAAPSVTRGLANACDAQGYHPQYVMAANTAGCSVEPPIYGPALDGCIQLSGSRLPMATDSPLVDEAARAWESMFPGEEFPAEGEIFWGLFDIYREAMKRAGPELTRPTFLAALDGLEYDNGLSNPIRFPPGSRIGGSGLVAWQADASIEGFREVVSEWTSDFPG